MACGLPVVTSIADASQDAVKNGELGILVDPDNLDELKAAVLEALARGKAIPPGLEYFSLANYSERLSRLVFALVD